MASHASRSERWASVTLAADDTRNTTTVDVDADDPARLPAVDHHQLGTKQRARVRALSSHRRGAQGRRSTDTTLCGLWAALGGDCRSCLHRGSTCCAHDTELAQCSPGVSAGLGRLFLCAGTRRCDGASRPLSLSLLPAVALLSHCASSRHHLLSLRLCSPTLLSFLASSSPHSPPPPRAVSKLRTFDYTTSPECKT